MHHALGPGPSQKVFCIFQFHPVDTGRGTRMPTVDKPCDIYKKSSQLNRSPNWSVLPSFNFSQAHEV